MARYSKGSFSLNPVRDGEILRQVHRCGYITKSQLFRFLLLEGTETKKRALTDRLARLIAAGYIGYTFDPQVNGKWIYFCTEKADDVLSHTGEPLPCRTGTATKYNRLEQETIVHWVDLAEINLLLKENQLLKRWISEPEIRATNDLTPYRFAKDYDAVIELASMPSLRIGIRV